MYAAVVVACLLSSAAAEQLDDTLLFGYSICNASLSSYFIFPSADECQAAIESPSFNANDNPKVIEFYFCIPDLENRNAS